VFISADLLRYLPIFVVATFVVLRSLYVYGYIMASVYSWRYRFRCFIVLLFAFCLSYFCIYPSHI